MCPLIAPSESGRWTADVQTWLRCGLTERGPGPARPVLLCSRHFSQRSGKLIKHKPETQD